MDDIGSSLGASIVLSGKMVDGRTFLLIIRLCYYFPKFIVAIERLLVLQLISIQRTKLNVIHIDQLSIF